MGKKSVVDGSFMESAFEDVNVPTEVRAARPVENLQELLVQMLKTAQQPKRKQALDMLV